MIPPAAIEKFYSTKRIEKTVLFLTFFAASTETLAHGLSFCDPHPPLIALVPFVVYCQHPAFGMESNGTIHCGHASNVR